jgi:peptide/nickel transport system substrate-binding protein
MRSWLKKRSRRLEGCLGVGIVIAAALITGSTAQAAIQPALHHGGSLTEVQVGLTWPGLDPATDNQAAADENIMGSVYGELFEQGPHNSILPDLATGYTFSNHNLTVTITIRHGVKFSDGTSFTAQDVVSNIERVLLPSNACICDADFTAIQSVTASGAYDVVIHLSTADAPIIEAFVESAPNWTVDPTALASMGEAAYAQHPVGAGPFVIASNSPSNVIVLNRNPGYWEKGEPYLNTLTIESVSNDQTAYNGLLSGSVQVAEELSTPSLITQAKSDSNFNVIDLPGANSSGIELNSAAPPFNNILAREAAYYATNPHQILAVVLDGGGNVTESPTGPGGAYYTPSVPGYRTYNLSKAEALVKQLGGLSVTISAPSTTPTTVTELEAIQDQWEAAGMTVKIMPETLGLVLSQYTTGGWEASTAGAGGPDPDIGIQGLAVHLGCHAALSGTCDTTLDGMINRSEQLVSVPSRAKVFSQIFKYVSTNAYEVYLYAARVPVISARSVTGLFDGKVGLYAENASGESNIYWESVALK